MYKTNCKRALSFVLMAAVCLCALTFPAAADDETALEVSSSAASAVLFEPSSGRVLFEQNAHVKRPMASTTKLMTALLAAESFSPHAELTATAQALDVIGSRVGLQVGDTVTAEDLLYGLLLDSGNDAANVFALSMAESYEAFAKMMNDRAQAIGMTDTCFVTPSGLDAEGHGASAYDMALLAAEVLKNERLATICAAKTATVTLGGRTVTLTNHNRLLSMYPDAIGMKTGYTSQSGRCLVSAAKRDGVTLIAVTLNCANDWEEHMALYEEGFSRLVSVELAPSAQSVTVYGGESDALALTAEAAYVAVLAEDRELIETEIYCPAGVWAPIGIGDEIGRVEYRLRGGVLATVPLLAASTIEIREREPWTLRVRWFFEQLLCEALT